MALPISIAEKGDTDHELRYMVVATHKTTGEPYISEKNNFKALGKAEKHAERLIRYSAYIPIEIKGYWIRRGQSD